MKTATVKKTHSVCCCQSVRLRIVHSSNRLLRFCSQNRIGEFDITPIKVRKKTNGILQSLLTPSLKLNGAVMASEVTRSPGSIAILVPGTLV